MIAEGFLIVQLLEKLSLRSTPPTVGPPPKDYTDYDPQGTYGDKLPDAPKPIRPPSGYKVDLDLFRYLK